MHQTIITGKGACLTAAALLGIFAMSIEAAEAELTLTVRASKHDYKNVPVQVALTSDALKKLGKIKEGAVRLDNKEDSTEGQVWKDGPNTYLTFLLRELPQGAERTYKVKPDSSAPTAVAIEKKGDDAVVMLGTQEFTHYQTKTSPYKPFLYPLLTPTGKNFSRRYPQEKVSGESQDHIHHRGLWFTHGNVNDVDFWAETEKSGKTVHTGYETTFGGPVTGGFVAKTEWRTPDNTLIATDRREVRVIPLPNGDRILDFEVAIKPNGKELHFGDTKEGSFGIRVNESLAPKPDKSTGISSPTGKMVNSNGEKDDAIWGKKATWVDYYGPLGGQTYGIAIFDHPSNFRHPTTWHARSYGLFAVNPFGLHDFGMGDKGAGDHRVPANETFTLRYRVFFHKADTASAGVAGQFAAYAEPPTIEIK